MVFDREPIVPFGNQERNKGPFFHEVPKAINHGTLLSASGLRISGMFGHFVLIHCTIHLINGNNLLLLIISYVVLINACCHYFTEMSLTIPLIQRLIAIDSQVTG